MKIGFKSVRQIISYLWMMVANLPMSGTFRWRFIKLAGVKFSTLATSEKRFVFIGKDVVFDTARPWLIEIGNNVHITTGSLLLTHYMEIDSNGWIEWHSGSIKIEDNV